jgi:hypothetical protein
LNSSLAGLGLLPYKSGPLPVWQFPITVPSSSAINATDPCGSNRM